jgi:hypothetical protein
MRGISKILPLSILAFSIYVGYIFILPILIASNISFLSDLYLSGDSDMSSDFTSGSFDALTSTHLDALQVSFFDLFFGFGKDPNKVLGMATDIGYIKIIYHVGLIGLISIFIIVLYILFKVIMFKVSENDNIDFLILKYFLIFYIIIILLFNFKSLELYSRGSHDMLLILFLFLNNIKFNNSLLFNVNSNKQIKI